MILIRIDYKDKRHIYMTENEYKARFWTMPESAFKFSNLNIIRISKKIF